VLRGRTLMRLGRMREAIATLEAGALQAQVDGSSHVRGELAMLTAAAFHRAGNVTEANEHFSAARAYVWSTTDADLHSELARHVATLHWSEGNLETAETQARQALRAKSPLHKALALELIGAIEGSRGHLQTQAACLEDALESLEQLDWREVWIEGAIIRTLAILARDVQLSGVAERVEHRAESMPWTDETAACRYDVLRNLGWCAAVGGDHLKAFRLLRESAEHAPTAAWRVSCFLDRSFLAREMQERLFAAAELESAERLAETVDWESTAGDERLALLLLSELVARHDVRRAESILERYRGIKRRMSVLLSQRDGLLRAIECHAYGVVAAAAGQTGRAAEMLDEAFAVWREFGFVWRATLTALEMAEMAGDARHVGYAREHVGSFPNSWFARSPALATESVHSASKVTLIA
jgi:tetratricopeptide (TPR) repeat protein